MSRMRCNNIKQEYNGTVFRIKRTLGDIIVPRNSHGIYTRPIPEGYYMNRNAVKKQNLITKFFKNMGEKIKGFVGAMKPDKPKHFDIDAKDIKGTTIEI